MIFPKHLSLTLSHNEHKNYYQTVEESCICFDHGYTEWVSPEQKQKAIETDECWTLQWYPDTPVGFNILSAADLDALLGLAGGDRVKRHDVRGCDCGHTPFDHDSVLICEPCEDAFRMAADALADAVELWRGEQRKSVQDALNAYYAARRHPGESAQAGDA